MKKLIVVAPTKKYIDFLNKNFWPHDTWKEGEVEILSTPYEGMPIPKRKMVMGLYSYVEKEG
jgi:hypothetical protein